MMQSNTALILLASGTSSRFGKGDKLLADFVGRPLAAHSAQLWRDHPMSQRFAIVPPGSNVLSSIFTASNWTILHNPNPKLGQARSLCIGIEAAKRTGAAAALICLADMPLIRDDHLNKILSAITTHDAVMSDVNGILMPPAAFKASEFDAMLTLKGNRGARAVFNSVETRTTISLAPSRAKDIDTPAELSALSKEGGIHA